MLKTGLILGSFFSLLTVILGAFGAHALKEQLTEYGQSIYDKAVFYQMFHAVGMFIVTFFGDYKFEIPRSSLRSYVELTQKEDEYEDYYNLCKKLGGKPRW